MDVLRTPDDRFASVPGFDQPVSYADVPDGEGGLLRMAYVDAGPSDMGVGHDMPMTDMPTPPVDMPTPPPDFGQDVPTPPVDLGVDLPIPPGDLGTPKAYLADCTVDAECKFGFCLGASSQSKGKCAANYVFAFGASTCEDFTLN